MTSDAANIDPGPDAPIGADMLRGAVDIHVHACPHINARSLDALQAARAAAAAGMAGLGLMDNFANSSGMAALARRQMAREGRALAVFGGLIMEPPAGGVSAEAARIALDYGYGPEDGARFISLPTHHTRHIARIEGRGAAYIDACLEIPASGPPPDPLPEILDLIAARGAVFNTGHVSGPEAVAITRFARSRGVEKILAPASHFNAETVRALADLGAAPEFSFFFASHATQAGLTHVDAERHTVPPVSGPEMAALIAAAGPARCILSSDCGVGLLPPPVEGLREFALLLQACGVAPADLRRMLCDNPRRLFRLAEGSAPAPTA